MCISFWLAAWLQRTSVYVSKCASVCVFATPSFIGKAWQRVHRDSRRRDKIAFSAPLLMTFTLSNGIEQGPLHKATYSTAACTPRNIGDLNLNHTHNWITSDDISCLEFGIVKCLSSFSLLLSLWMWHFQKQKKIPLILTVEHFTDKLLHSKHFDFHS